MGDSTVAALAACLPPLVCQGEQGVALGPRARSSCAPPALDAPDALRAARLHLHPREEIGRRFATCPVNPEEIP